MRALIVEPQHTEQTQLTKLVSKICGLEHELAHSLWEGQKRIESCSFDVAFINMCVPPDSINRDGLELVRAARAHSVAPVVISSFGGMDAIRATMRMGAHDYLLAKDLCEHQILSILDDLRARERSPREVPLTRDGAGDSALGNMVGPSRAMQNLKMMVRRVAPSSRPALVTGPTGAGKELTVRALHLLGPHPDGPLLDVNCGAFPEPLIESMLFGHERGAFTGADRQRDGYLTAVGEGTLFLDEVAELPLELQAKLLRVLETQTFRPLGSNTIRKFRGRVIAATHVDLEERIEQRRFREDLYYRLNVLEIQIPALSERREDIPHLVAHFASAQPRPLSFTQEALRLLEQVPWPGNVRQLRNAVDRLAVHVTDEVITAEVIEKLLRRERPQRKGRLLSDLVREVINTPEKDKLRLVNSMLIDEALRIADGNKSAAARLLGVHRKVVERKEEQAQTLARRLDADPVDRLSRLDASE